MSTSTALIVTLISMVFSAFFSGMEIAFITSNRVRVGLDSQKKGVTNHLINFFYRHQDMFISTLLVGNNIMLVIYGIGMAILLTNLMPFLPKDSALTLLVQTILSTLIILITGEFIPKTVFKINPNASLRHFSLPIFIIYLVLYPISLLASLISRGIMILLGARPDETRGQMITVGELDDYIQQTIEEKRAEKKTEKDKEEEEDIQNEMKIFQNALDFSNTLLRDCMRPRNEIVGVDIEKTELDVLRQRFHSTGLSKIIVYREDIDDIVGYIHVGELFHTENNWKEHIRPVEFAPESMLANKMMRRMMTEKKSIAIIVDEFGGTSGLVTLEDLVEEIFGDFEDEHDKKRLIDIQFDENHYKFSGRVEIEKINEKYNLGIPENDEYQTNAGYILYNLEELPEQNDSFVIDGLRFTIVKRSATKINIVDVERIADADNE